MSEEGMGVLDVFVFKASGLVKMDLTGLCDPYVTLTMTNDDGTGGGKVKRTKYIRQNLNPEFNQEFQFTVYKLSQMLVIKVYDHDDLGADDLMGTRRIPVAELVEKDWQEWFHMLDQLGHEIIGEDGTMCRVKLDIKYTPHPTREMAALGRAIYVDAGAGEHQVKESIKRAAGCQPRKRVLIQFGADWNDSCKKFHFLLREDKDCAAMCAEFFEYFLLDAEHEANFDIMKRLGEPQWLGFPVFVILDHAGAYIHTQSAGHRAQHTHTMPSSRQSRAMLCTLTRCTIDRPVGIRPHFHSDRS